MKKFNLKLITPLLLTLVFQGCMPDSLTKFKKDEPKKASTSSSSSSTSTTPVVDSSGAAVPFTHPTHFYYGTSPSETFDIAQHSTVAVSPSIDGSLGDKALSKSFFISCALDTTGNSQTTTLPPGVKLDPSTCAFKGTPSSTNSIITPFCSDPTYTDQASCESSPLVWNSATSTCSNNDFQYGNQTDCEANFNTWYEFGSEVPYKVKFIYKDSAGTNYTIYATTYIGIYSQIQPLSYSQADKVVLNVTPAGSSDISTIVPIQTTTSTVGNYVSGNILSEQNGYWGVANYVDVANKVIGVRRLNKIILNNSSNFTAGGFITTASGKVGKIFKKDTSTNAIYVENLSSGEAFFAIGDQLDNAYPFVAAENVGVTSTKVQIMSIDETIMADTAAPNVDNDLQYFQSKYTITNVTNAYMVNSASNIKPIKPLSSFGTNNAVTFSVSPKLPSGLTLDETTGVITGKFLTRLDPTSFVITAQNPLGSVSKTIRLMASSAPGDMSLTTKQIITVSNTAFFTEGEDLFQAIVPPLASAPHGKILKILNSYQMAIATVDGAFLAGASLDSGSAFYGEKAFIIPNKSCVNTNYNTDQTTCETNGYTWSTGPIYYNLALTVSTSGNYDTGSCSDVSYLAKDTCEAAGETWTYTYVQAVGKCTNHTSATSAACAGAGGGWTSYTNGAKGVVSGIYTAITGDILLIQYVTQSATAVASAKTFYIGDGLNDGLSTVSFIDNESLVLGVGDTTGFVVGADITSDYSSGAYTHKVSGTVNGSLYVSDITQSAGKCSNPNYVFQNKCVANGGSWTSSTQFKIGDNLYNDEVYTAGTTAIATVTHDNLIIVERGKKTVIHANLPNGGATYSITPSLPIGLTLNTVTGEISGTPTVMSARKDMLLTATNFMGQVTYAFSLEVRDYFKITESSGASSYVLHKVGETQVNRKCQVNASDIQSNSTAKALDVRCFLDGDEEDFYFHGVKLNAEVGPGICNFIQYVPYYFNYYAPAQSVSTTSKYQSKITVVSGCSSVNTAPSPADACEGDYESAGGPNCDEGYVEYTQQIWDDHAGAGTCTNHAALQTTVKVNCGGKKINCLNGPIKDVLSDDALSKGNRSVIYASTAGIAQSWTHTAPINKVQFTNMRVVNGVVSNKCTMSRTDASAWATSTATQSNLDSPFGGQNPFYGIYCLDAAKEIKARIRIVARDWDRAFKLKDGIDNQNPSALETYMDTDNNAAPNDPIFGTAYNQIADWDNNYTQSAVGGLASYKGASCGVLDTAAANKCSGAWPTSSTDCSNVGGSWQGTCDDNIHTTNAGCVAAGKIWTAYAGGGNDCQFYTRYQCELHSGTWTPGTAGSYNFKFPGGDL